MARQAVRILAAPILNFWDHHGLALHVDTDAQCLCFLRYCVWLWQAWHTATSGRKTKYKKKLVPVTAFELITGGALQKIGEFDNQ